MKYFKHKYPQNVWANQIAKEIIPLLKEVSDNSVIVDAPCGNGIIASLVNQAVPDRRFLALDINPDLLLSPYAKKEDKSPDFKIHDIFSQLADGEDNIWLFINSMYCLSDIERLFDIQKPSFKFIVAVFPDIETDNYKYFLSVNPEFKNPSAMNLENTVNFMQQHGFNVIKRIGNTKIKFHIWNHKFIFKRMPNTLRNILYTCIDKLLFFKSPQYSLMIFKRYE